MKQARKHLLAIAILAAAGSAAADSITLYTQDNYRGRQITVDRPLSSFNDSGFNDRAHSVVVHEGRWEICYDSDFRGACSVLEPGTYPELGAYAGRISSLRPVGRRQMETRVDERPRGDGRGREARATLFEGQNLSGRSFAVSEMMRDLDRTGFNDRATSLRIESGYWIFCTDSEFRGECRTFGPGEYASLPGMNNAISSGRRIANAYPYGERPDWQRR